MAHGTYVEVGMTAPRYCGVCCSTTKHVAETPGGCSVETERDASDTFVHRHELHTVPALSCNECGARVALMLCAKATCPRSLAIVEDATGLKMVAYLEGLGLQRVPLVYHTALTLSTRHYLCKCGACDGAATAKPPAGWSAPPM